MNQYMTWISVAQFSSVRKMHRISMSISESLKKLNPRDHIFQTCQACLFQLMMGCTKTHCCLFHKVFLEVWLVWLPLASTAVATKTPNRHKNLDICTTEQRQELQITHWEMNMPKQACHHCYVPKTAPPAWAPSKRNGSCTFLCHLILSLELSSGISNSAFWIYLAELSAMSHFAGEVKSWSAENSFWSHSLLWTSTGRVPPAHLGVPAG